MNCRVCKKVCVQYSLDLITESLSELCIVHPHGLFAGNECLTYINRGTIHYAYIFAEMLQNYCYNYRMARKFRGYKISFNFKNTLRK